MFRDARVAEKLSSFCVVINRSPRYAQIACYYFHGPAHLQRTGFFQVPYQYPSVFCLQRTWRSTEPCRKLVNFAPYCIGAKGVQRLLNGLTCIDSSELIHHILQTAKQCQIHIDAQCCNVLSIVILDANRRAFGLPAISEMIGIVCDNLWVCGVGDARQAKLCSRIAYLATGKIIMDRQDRMPGILKVV